MALHPTQVQAELLAPALDERGQRLATATSVRVLRAALETEREAASRLLRELGLGQHLDRIA
ncbi:MAG: hypothetical protein JSV80_08925 [Acidobacteriota bacterium]|nr:MAG: hypothetical protein JSV80_08925 [Acidobacteriota bacterium]